MNQSSELPYYRPHIMSQRASTIRHNSRNQGIYNQRQNVIYSNHQSNHQIGSKNAKVLAISDARSKEKRDLIGLNDKFANLIERVRFLEAQNKKLQMELTPLINLENKQSSSIKNMYETELTGLQSFNNQVVKERESGKAREVQMDKKKSGLKDRLSCALNEHDMNKKKIGELVSALAKNDAEINLLKRRLDDMDGEVRSVKRERDYLAGEIGHFTVELDVEVGNRLQLGVELKALEEELEFVKRMHGQEIVAARKKLLDDVGSEAGSFFKSELAKYIRQLRDDYETKCLKQHSEMEQWYRIKLQETQQRNHNYELSDADVLLSKSLKTSISEQKRENARLKASQIETVARIKDLEDLIRHEKLEAADILNEKSLEMNSLTTKIAMIMGDYDELIKTKTSLEAEIGTYRRLLEGDEESEGLTQVVDSIRSRQVTDRLRTGVGRDRYEITVENTVCKVEN